MRVTDVTLTAEQLAGTLEGTAYATDLIPGYEYENGKRTETISHTKVTGVFPENGFEKIVVKVKGTKIPLTKEQIIQQGGKVNVRFKNLTGRFYRTNSGEYALSASAEGLEVM